MAAEPQIVVPGFQASLEDWTLAQTAPESQLPPLDHAEEHAAGKMGISPLQYRRSKLALQLGHRRREDEARRLAVFAAAALAPKTGARVVRVTWQADQMRWLVAVERGKREYGVPLAFELVDDALQSKVLKAENELRRALRSGVGLAAPEAKH